MSKALRCDRCGECFDPYKVGNEFCSFQNFVVRNSTSYKNNEVIYHDDELDFCPKCTMAIMRMFAMTEGEEK